MSLWRSSSAASASLALPEPSAEEMGERSSSESSSERLRSGPGCHEDDVGVDGEVGVDGVCAAVGEEGGGFPRRSRMDLAVWESLECALLRHEAFFTSFSRKGTKASTRRGSDSGEDSGGAAAAEAIIPRRIPGGRGCAAPCVDLDLGGAGRGLTRCDPGVRIAEWGEEGEEEREMVACVDLAGEIGRAHV